MMKNFKLMSLMMALLACLFTFSACNDDKEDNNSNTGNNGGNNGGQVVNGLDQRLIGTWTCIVSEGWEYSEDGVMLTHWKDLSAISTERWEYDENGQEISHNVYNEPNLPEWETTTFKADGTFTDINEDGPNSSGTWQAANGVLTATVNGRSSTQTYYFQGNTLVITSEDYDTEDGKRYLAGKTIDYFERGTFNPNTNTIDPNGSYTPDETVTPQPVQPTPDSNFAANLIGVWKSYKGTVSETSEVYNITSNSDEAYAEFEFKAGGVARYSFWDSDDDDGGDEDYYTRSLVKKAMQKVQQNAQFVNISLSYSVSGTSVYVFEPSSQVGITLNYSAPDAALILSTPVSNGQGQTYTVNIYFHK